MKQWTEKFTCGLGRGSFLVLGSALLWGGCALSMQGQAATPDTLLRDHATSASYYRQEAARARQAAEVHATMLVLYRGEAQKAGAGSAVSAQSSQMQHCERVVQSFRDAANALDALAQDHDQEVGTPVPSLFINRGSGT